MVITYKLKRSWLILFSFALFTSTACFAQVVGGGLDTSVPPPVESEEPIPIDVSIPDDQASDSVEEILELLTLDQKVMQLMFVVLSGDLAPTSVDSKLLKMLTPGGIILPGIGSAGNTIEYVNLIRKIEPTNPGSIPFFIAGDAFAISDKSAKNSNRFIRLPSMLSLGATTDVEDRSKLFDTIADDFYRMGLNTHFGPSLSLPTLIESKRSALHTFGSDPGTTGAISGRLLEAFYSNDILWMPRGFPGGENNRSGASPATLLTPGAHYIERDGLPYLIAIKHGLPMLHVANTLVPTIDPNLTPASLSPKVIRTLLKGTLNYKGLVIAGPMDGPHIVAKYEPEVAALQSLLAGADMLMWSRTSPQIPKAIGLIVGAVQNGNIDEAVIDDAVRRILTLKMKFGLFERPLPETQQSVKIKRENEKLKVASRIERRAITLLKNDRNLLPLVKGESTPLFLTGVVDLIPLDKALTKKLKYVNHFEIKTAKHTARVQDFELSRIDKLAKGVRTAVCIFDNKIDERTQAEVIGRFKRKNMKVVVALMGEPKNINVYDNADALLVIYGSSSFLDSSIQALSEILLGNAPVRVLSGGEPLNRMIGQKIVFDVLDVIQSPTGKLPIALEPAYSVGHSVSYSPLSIKKVRWDFGDGSQSKKHRDEHSYSKAGRYVAAVTVETTDGESSSGTFEINVQ